MSTPVQVPADVEREDTLLGPLTARQLVVVITTAALLYGLWSITGPRHLVVFVLAAVPVALIGTALTVGRRDGLSLDRLLLAALRQRAGLRTVPRTARPRLARPGPGRPGLVDSGPTDPDSAAGAGRLVATRLPVRGVRASGSDRLGVVDLAASGSAVVCAVSPLNLSLRSGPEQDAAVGGFARWLHSLSGPVQLLTRTRPLDLSGPITRLREAAGRLGHPALTRAALAHAAHLHALDAHAELLHREFLIIFRDPTPRGSTPSDSTPGGRGPRAVTATAEALRRRAGEAAALLGPLGLRVTPLSDADAAAVLRRAMVPATALRHTPATNPLPNPVTATPRTGPVYRDPPTVELAILPWAGTGPPWPGGEELDHETDQQADHDHDYGSTTLGGVPR